MEATKIIDNQARSGKPKIIDFKAVLEAMKSSNTWRVCYLHDLDISV